MPSETDPSSPVQGIIEHLRRALGHAQEALRCTVAHILGQAERRVEAAARRAIWSAFLAGVALLGIVLLVCGLAVFLESRLGMPGAGLMVMGGALLALVLVLAVSRAGGRHK